MKKKVLYFRYILLILLITCILVFFYNRYNVKKIESFKDSIDSVIENINSKYFQIITPEFLNNLDIDNYKYKEVAELFEIDYIINKQKQPNCMSVSLFCQNVNNSYPNEYLQPSIENGSSWYNKYFSKLIKIIEDFNNSDYNQTWKIRIYLEKKLINLIEPLKKNNIEIYVMNTNSVGAQPGMLWRYMAFDDNSIESLLCADIDEDFSDIRKNLDVVHKCNRLYPEKVFIRTGPYYKNPMKQYIIKEGDDAINVTVVLGSRVGFFPKRSHIDTKDLMIKYICLRMYRKTSKYPHLDYDSEDPPTIFNKPIDTFGWGGHWFRYGFDEKFLKAVIFPYFTMRGETISIVNNSEEPNKIKELNDSVLNLYFKAENKFHEYYKNIYHQI